MEDKMNLDKYTEISQAVLKNSLTIANSFSHQHVTCFHLFKAICIEKNSSILALLENSNLNIKELNDNQTANGNKKFKNTKGEWKNIRVWWVPEFEPEIQVPSIDVGEEEVPF